MVENTRSQVQQSSEAVERTNLDRVMDGFERNLRQGRVLVAAPWFQVDAYGAAIRGILGSIQLALASGSIGQGDEENTLKRVRGLLYDLDPAIRREE